MNVADMLLVMQEEQEQKSQGLVQQPKAEVRSVRLYYECLRNGLSSDRFVQRKVLENELPCIRRTLVLALCVAIGCSLSVRELTHLSFAYPRYNLWYPHQLWFMDSYYGRLILTDRCAVHVGMSELPTAAINRRVSDNRNQ